MRVPGRHLEEDDLIAGTTYLFTWLFEIHRVFVITGIKKEQWQMPSDRVVFFSEGIIILSHVMKKLADLQTNRAALLSLKTKLKDNVTSRKQRLLEQVTTAADQLFNVNQTSLKNTQIFLESTFAKEETAIQKMKSNLAKLKKMRTDLWQTAFNIRKEVSCKKRRHASLAIASLSCFTINTALHHSEIGPGTMCDRAFCVDLCSFIGLGTAFTATEAWNRYSNIVKLSWKCVFLQIVCAEYPLTCFG
ncbi:unnamed protein product [Dibothriocephalus latus]|uniref:Uncharacterized protein n=1 Tax=Dibothriocephalus latus TaxID=60516 RepID=A0A3P7LGF5_DIBLA|nr:unnamed protein product [Dibothriocephalus latus]